MPKTTVKDRIKQLRKEMKYNTDKKKKMKTIDITKHQRKQRKKQIKGFKSFYREYLDSLDEDDKDEELLNIEIMYGYPTEKEMYDEYKRQRSIEKQKEKEYKKLLKKKNPKNLSELDQIKDKYYKKNKKMTKKLRKHGFDLYDPIFSVTKIDEKKMIKNLRKISRENEERSQGFLEYMDKLYEGGDMPDIVDILNEKNKQIEKSTQKFIDSLQKNGLDKGMRFK